MAFDLSQNLDQATLSSKPASSINIKRSQFAIGHHRDDSCDRRAGTRLISFNTTDRHGRSSKLRIR